MFLIKEECFTLFKALNENSPEVFEIRTVMNICRTVLTLENMALKPLFIILYKSTGDLKHFGLISDSSSYFL